MNRNELQHIDPGEGLDEESPTGRHSFPFSLSSVLIGIFLIAGLTYWHQPIADGLGVHRPITMLEHSGAVLLNVSQLKDHVTLPMHGDHKRYWLGPLSGASYTTNCVQLGILKVDYFTTSQSLGDGIHPAISVTAYQNHAYYYDRLRPLATDLPTVVTNSRGDTLSYHPASLNRLTIEPKGSQEVITIDYSSPQSVMSMIHDSEDLVAL